MLGIGAAREVEDPATAQPNPPGTAKESKPLRVCIRHVKSQLGEGDYAA